MDVILSRNGVEAKNLAEPRIFVVQFLQRGGTHHERR
jgi:hypothetical protein